MNMEASHTPPSIRRQQLLDAALSYAARGWHIFPLQPDQKLPFKGTHGVSDATTDEAQIRAWWQRWPRANIGIAGGNGLIILDEDTYKGADAGQFLLPVTLTACSARGGLHRYFAYDGDLGNAVEGKLAAGISFRGKGYYVVAPPSTFQGSAYAWIDEEQPIAQLPERIAQLIRDDKHATEKPIHIMNGELQPKRNDNSGEHWVDKAVEKARSAGRNNAGIWLAQQLVWNDCIDPEGAMRYYARLVEDWEKPHYTEREALASLAQARKHAKREPARSQTARPLPARPKLHAVPTVAEEPADYGEHYSGDEPPTEQKPKEIHNRTDLGNARRFVERHGQNVRHVAAWGSWLIWDGQRWRKDVDGEAIRKAKETARAMWKECADLEDDKDRQEMARHCARSEGESRLKAMLSLAESEPEVAITPERLDANPWLLNVLNGTVDLKTGELLHHDRAHLCSKIAPVDYDALAACPTWLAFLNRIFAGDTDLVSYVQRAVGYALTCEISEQCVFVLHGSGANGKSTFLDTLTRLLGDYGMTTPADTLMWKQNTGIPSDVARLMGARFVSASESADGRRLDEEFVKRISGGDKISARFMHHDWFEFWPVLKLFLAANHKPNIRGTDNGIWRRIQLWPFDVTIPKEEQDRHLAKKLQAEAPGILAWAVRGCLIWQQEGLNPPTKVTGATAEYRSEMDAIGRFIKECCILKPNAEARGKRLYEAYSAWCEENGEKDFGQHKFGRYLREDCGLKKEHARGGSLWSGIGLIE